MLPRQRRLPPRTRSSRSASTPSFVSPRRKTSRSPWHARSCTRAKPSSGRRQAIARLHQQGNAAAAKLAYLLGLGSCVQLVPVEAALTPIDLVNPKPPTANLVAQALANGPGIHEMQSMLTTMQAGLDRI